MSEASICEIFIAMSKKVINSSIHNWINNNKEILRQYRGKWIAHNDTEVLAFAEKGEDLMRILKEKMIENYTLAYVQPSWYDGVFRILPIRFRTFQKNDWSPDYEISLMTEGVKKNAEMLVDSGADISLIPLWLGKELGFQLTTGEIIENANGVGGSVNYVIRRLDYEIDNNLIKDVPTAWALDEDCNDIILGREVIFDAFDIEFKQADEEIIFKWRG